jgi:hypothetical protein
MITALSNDVSKKREFWQRFANKYQCDFNFGHTPHRDVNILTLLCYYNNINISFKESDAKPLICEFKIRTEKNIKIEVYKKSIFDRLSSIFHKKDNVYESSFLKTNKIKSNHNQILISLLKDKYLLNLLNKSEFFSLYAHTEKNFLKVNITFTYFVNSYEKLIDTYSIACKIIEHLKKHKIIRSKYYFTKTNSKFYLKFYI